MKQKLFLIILLLSCIKVQAQSVHQKGFIVTQQSDTIQGLIKSKANTINLKHCLFKPSQNEEEKTYWPNQLISIQFDQGEKYLTIDHLNKKDEIEQVFALVLEKGRMNLYHYKNSYYVQKQKGKITKLENNEIEVVEHGLAYRKASQKYIGILSYLMSDLPKLRPQIQRVNYSGKDISQLINKYNLHFDNTTKRTEDKAPWSVLEFGGFLSTSFSRPDFSISHDPLPDHLTNANWDISQQYGIGFFLENRYSKIAKNMAVHIEAHLQKITYSSNFETSYLGTEYVFNNQLEHFALNIPLGIKYYHSFTNMKGYIMGGAFFRKTFAHNDKTTSLRKMSNNIFIQPEIDSYEPISHKIGLWLSIGIRKKLNDKLDLFSEIRYSQNQNKVGSQINNTRFKAKQKIINIGLHVGLYF